MFQIDAERAPAIPTDEDDHRSVVSAEASSVASSAASKRSSSTISSMIPAMPTFIRKKNASRKPQRLQLASLQAGIAAPRTSITVSAHNADQQPQEEDTSAFFEQQQHQAEEEENDGNDHNDDDHNNHQLDSNDRD